MDRAVLESKLKRHRISYFFEKDSLIIGKAKNDYLTIIGFIILPFIGGVSLILLFYVFKTFGNPSFSGKIIFIVIALLLVSGYNFLKIKFKKQTNNISKEFKNNKIIISYESDPFEITKENTLTIGHRKDKLTEEIYRGFVAIIDRNKDEHIILGIDDVNPQYLENDLHWFSTYIAKHLGNENDEKWLKNISS